MLFKTIFQSSFRFTAKLSGRFSIYILLPHTSLASPIKNISPPNLNPRIAHWLSTDKPTLTHQFSSVQSLSCIWLFVTPWTAAHQSSLSITNSWSLLKLISIESVMPSNRPLILLPSIFPSIRVFSNELALHIRWPKYWSFSFSLSPSSEYSGSISFRMD